MKQFFTYFLLLFFSPFLFAQINVDSISNLDYNIFVNDVWGYVAPDSTEYALVGTESGVSIVSLSDPTTPTEVAFISGGSSTWRDLKTWEQSAYVTTEAFDGLLVIDLSNLPDSVNHYFWQPTLEEGGPALSSCHNLYIDENGYCYLSGSNLNIGGLVIADLFTNPDTPTIAGVGPAIYSHDVYVRNNIAYSSDIEDGRLSILDVSDKTNVQILAVQETPFLFAHNAWPSDDGRIIFVTEEIGNAPTTAYDISDLTDIRELDRFVPLSTIGQGVIPHNVHYLDGYLVLSHYGDGLVIVDAARPDNLIEVGNFDTSPSGLVGFVGAWGAYPFLPSGLILISDSQNGLFVLQPNYQRACYLEGVITDASTNEGLFEATITFVGTNTSENSNLMGTVKTGLVTPGTYEILVEKRGYISQTITVEMENGVVTPINVILEPAPTFNVTGTVVGNENGMPVEGVTINLVDSSTIEAATSDSLGAFSFDGVLENTYSLVAGKWGFTSVIINELEVNEGNGILFVELEEAIEDPFALDLGWTVTNDNIVIGNGFQLGVPVTSPELPFLVDDEPSDIGASCYSTANAIAIPDNIFIFGRTELKSPIFDVSDMITPTISYYTNFANFIGSSIDDISNGTESLLVYLENGVDKVLVETITNRTDLSNLELPSWEVSTLDVEDFITPTDRMQISFVLESDDFDSAFEVGVDNFKVFDASTVSTIDFIQSDLAFAVTPNPFNDQLSIQYEPTEWQELPMIHLSDALGRTVFKQTILSENHTYNLPKLESGIYFIQLRGIEKGSKVLKLVK